MFTAESLPIAGPIPVADSNEIRALTAYFSGLGIPQDQIRHYLKLTDLRKKWHHFAVGFAGLPRLTPGDRKAVEDALLNKDYFGGLVRDVFDLFSSFTAGNTVAKEILPIYGAVRMVAAIRPEVGHGHVPAVAAALCRMVEFDRQEESGRTLTLFIGRCPDREEGYYCWDVDSRELSWLGTELPTDGE